jgi:hypothetical protein
VLSFHSAAGATTHARKVMQYTGEGVVGEYGPAILILHLHRARSQEKHCQTGPSTIVQNDAENALRILGIE